MRRASDSSALTEGSMRQPARLLPSAMPSAAGYTVWNDGCSWYGTSLADAGRSPDAGASAVWMQARATNSAKLTTSSVLARIRYSADHHGRRDLGDGEWDAETCIVQAGSLRFAVDGRHD